MAISLLMNKFSFQYSSVAIIHIKGQTKTECFFKPTILPKSKRTNFLFFLTVPWIVSFIFKKNSRVTFLILLYVVTKSVVEGRLTKNVPQIKQHLNSWQYPLSPWILHNFKISFTQNIFLITTGQGKQILVFSLKILQLIMMSSDFADNQSHCMEVMQGAIFTKKIWNLGWFWGQLAKLKKKCAN